MSTNAKGRLIIIGGSEEKNGHRNILEEVSETARADQGRLVIVTVATQAPDELAAEYTNLFKEMGVKDIEVLDIRTRDDAYDQANVDKLQNAATIFFTGGDQLRITSQIGDSLVFRMMRDCYRDGSVIVGTSAGAAAMPETMLIGGPGDESAEISALSMAPGLGLISGVVVDTHFAERGRMGRLLGAVVQNPRNLGIGIDEDTAVMVHDGHFTVVGSGAVYVVDGAGISYSSLSEEQPEGVVTIHDVKLHVLGDEDRFDMNERNPLVEESEQEGKG
jgi:cyanophycinase